MPPVKSQYQTTINNIKINEPGVTKILHNINIHKVRDQTESQIEFSKNVQKSWHLV